MYKKIVQKELSFYFVDVVFCALSQACRAGYVNQTDWEPMQYLSHSAPRHKSRKKTLIAGEKEICTPYSTGW